MVELRSSQQLWTRAALGEMRLRLRANWMVLLSIFISVSAYRVAGSSPTEKEWFTLVTLLLAGVASIVVFLLGLWSYIEAEREEALLYEASRTETHAALETERAGQPPLKSSVKR